MPGEQAFPFQTERRTVLDGGLDTRAGVFVDGTKTTQLQNFRFSETGSLTKRKGGARLCLVDPLDNASDLPAPVITGSAAGGTLAAGTYKVKYVLGTIHGGTVGASTESTGYVAGGATSSILVELPANDNAETVGTLPSGLSTVVGIDNPINGGYVNSSTTKVYLDKDAGGFKLQSTFSFTFNFVTGRWNLTITSYNAAGAAAPNLTDALPFRSLHWNPGADMTIGWIGDRVVSFQGAHTSAAYLSRATDKSGVLYGFSRTPTRIHAAILDNVMVATDGFGKPKKLSMFGGPSGSSSDWDFRVCGAVAPASAVSPATNVAGVLTGAYFYVVTYVVTVSRPDGTTLTSESNGSAVSAVVNPAAQKVLVSSIPVSLERGGVAGTNSVVKSRRLYRTVAGGATYFFLDTIADNSTTTYLDNTADSGLVRDSRPPDATNQIPNDPPPSKLHFITEHVGRLWAAVMTWVEDGANIVLRLRGTNEIRYTKAGSIDAWPSTFSIKCGRSSPITALKSFRGVLYVFKQDEIGFIDGSGEDSDLSFAYRTIWTGCGAMENSVVEVKDSLYCFDQALTAVRVSGYSVDPVAEDAIQTQWASAITLSASGEASTGGGRGAALVLNVIWDPLECEVRWVISDFVTDYTVVAATSYVMKAYEYVMQVRDSSPKFGVFTGAVEGTYKDRRVMGSCNSVIGANAIYQARDVLYGDYHGQLVRDNQNETDIGGVSSTLPISISAAWPMFFGDNPEAVKLWRYLYALITTGATAGDALTFSTKSLSKQAGGGVPKTLQLVNGGSTENRMIRMDLKDTLDSVNTADRGLLLQLAGTAASGPLHIRELAAKMTSGHDGRNAP